MTLLDRNPTGYCECGCGERTEIATVTSRAAGRLMGTHQRFIRGHNTRVQNPNHRPGPDYLEDEETGCWVWQRAKIDNGYGRTRRNGKNVQAHRAFYEDCFGSITSGQVIHHKCSNRACVNPDHLEALDDREHRSQHSQFRADAANLVLRSGLTLEEVAKRLGVR